MTKQVGIRHSIFLVLLFVLVHQWTQSKNGIEQPLLPVVQALYVSYEALNLYKVGDRYVTCYVMFL